jgi:hypothetical protein
VQGRACREDIVQKHQVFSVHVATLAQGECIAQVLHSLDAVKLGLSAGVAAALNAAQNRQPGPLGESFGESVGLVKSALPQSRRVQRHRDQAIHRVRLYSCVLHGFGEVLREHAAQIKLPTVFKAMDEISQDTLRLVAGHRAGKSRGAIFAVGAGEFSRNETLEWSGATAAEGGLDADGCLLALITEQRSQVLRLSTPDTIGGVEQLKHRIKQDPNWIAHVVGK